MKGCSKAVAKMAIPSVISSLVTVVYNMADTFLLDRLGDPLQVAAVSTDQSDIYFTDGICEICSGWVEVAVASMAMGEKMRNG